MMSTLNWGRWTHFDEHIFSKWAGSSTTSKRPPPQSTRSHWANFILFTLFSHLGWTFEWYDVERVVNMKLWLKRLVWMRYFAESILRTSNLEKKCSPSISTPKKNTKNSCQSLSWLAKILWSLRTQGCASMNLKEFLELDKMRCVRYAQFFQISISYSDPQALFLLFHAICRVETIRRNCHEEGVYNGLSTPSNQLNSVSNHSHPIPPRNEHDFQKQSLLGFLFEMP